MEVGLSSSISSTLGSLKRIAELSERTQSRIATGQQHEKFSDNPLAVSVAKGLSDRASDLLGVKDSIGQGVSSVETATAGLESIQDVLGLLKATAQQYEQATSATEQAAATSQFNELSAQLDGLARDSSFGGTSLISSSPDNLTLGLNENNSSTLTVDGVASDSATLGLDITNIATIDAALSTVRSSAETLSAQASALSIREDFNQDLVNSLEEGEAKLIEADLNEQAANALSLETRTQLSVAALQVTTQSERSILQLF